MNYRDGEDAANARWRAAEARAADLEEKLGRAEVPFIVRAMLFLGVLLFGAAGTALYFLHDHEYLKRLEGALVVDEDGVVVILHHGTRGGRFFVEGGVPDRAPPPPPPVETLKVGGFLLSSGTSHTGGSYSVEAGNGGWGSGAGAGTGGSIRLEAGAAGGARSEP